VAVVQITSTTTTALFHPLQSHPTQPNPIPPQIAARVSDFQKGLLTVKLIQAKALASGDAVVGTTNPYVELTLVDCDKLRWGGAPRCGPAFCLEAGFKFSPLIQLCSMEETKLQANKPPCIPFRTRPLSPPPLTPSHARTPHTPPQHPHAPPHPTPHPHQV